jgi:VanZ family protein
MALVLILSTEAFSFGNTLGLVEAVLVRAVPAEAALAPERINAQARTGAHVVEYGVLAILLGRALAGDRRRTGQATMIALAISLAWAVMDEAHQAQAPTRRGKVADVALDAAGGVLGIAVWLAGARRRMRLNQGIPVAAGGRAGRRRARPRRRGGPRAG